ncbi:conjugal transfer protein TraM [Legionella busanensis]|uniref:Conjugal transfer protein TraM n=1 Tax=Legionella busanensis TaxID=190655 RepID=A0A378JFU9_9GAMM|nr:conjugal transfer protein TraM [Legionella busanensis]STX50146.1 conjugal transfer protein TraM [Legionella busanensis]
MSDKFDEAIQEIALKHGVVLSKDDPILVLQTMNERLIEENRQAQVAMLAKFREEIEDIASQWKDDAKDKAEKVLNSALEGSKEVMARLLQETNSHFAQTIKITLSETLMETHTLAKQARKYNLSVLLYSTTILIGGCLFILFYF